MVKAFWDTLWPDGLIHRQNWDSPILSRLIHSFLSNPPLRARMDKTLSAPYALEARVSQALVLSPTIEWTIEFTLRPTLMIHLSWPSHQRSLMLSLRSWFHGGGIVTYNFSQTSAHLHPPTSVLHNLSPTSRVVIAPTIHTSEWKPEDNDLQPPKTNEIKYKRK